MRLFWRHIARSIKRAPLQPLLIALTVTLAVAIAVSALRISQMFAVHAEQEAMQEQELGDLLISMRGDSDTRIMFDEDAKALLGEDGAVLGEFRLTAFYEQAGDTKLLATSATDLVAADAFYSFEFLEYGRFTAETLDRSAVLSASAAEAYGLSLGDTFTIKLLNEAFTYRVEAIAADTGLLAEVDLLISISGVTEALAARVPLVASLGSSFAPYSGLMIRVAQGRDVSEIADRFTNSPLFADKTVSVAANETRSDFFALLQAVFIWMVAFLLLILTVVLIGSSLKLLHNRRSGEYALFGHAGAAPRQLRMLVLIESFCYAAVGGALGVLLAVPVLRGISSFYSWKKEPMTVGVFGVFFGIGFAFLLMLVCTLLHLRRHHSFDSESADGRSPEDSRVTLWEWLIPLLIGAVSFALMLALPIKLRYLAGVPLLISIVWLLFVLVPPLLQLLARLVDKTRGRPAFLLSVKNIRNRFSLRHVGRLLAIVFSLVFTLAVCVQAFARQVDGMTDDFPSDMVAVRLSESAKSEVEADLAVRGTMQMSYFLGAKIEEATGVTALSLSGDAALCYSSALLPKRLPAAGEVAVSKGLAALAGVGVGDAVTVTVEGVPHVLTVREIVSIHANFIYLDAEALGYASELFCIRLHEGAEDDPEVAARLLAILEADGAASLPLNQVFDVLPATLSGHLRLLRWCLAAAVLLSLVACMNVLAQQYRERAAEREIQRVCGMERRTILGMYLWECLLVALSALAIAALTAGVICLLIDLALRSFGMVLFV